MPFLIGVIILILFLIFVYFYFKFKLKKITKEYFGTTNLKKALELSKINEDDTPKSLGSMDSLYLERFKHDFPNSNINELKRLSESIILEIISCIENKDIDKLNNKNEKIISFVKSKINDLENKEVKYSNVHIHNTVLNKYEATDAIATIYLATSFEYYKKIDSETKKIQNRVKTEFIYIIDSSKVEENIKSLGLNCPNCGAPIRSLNHKSCSYCKTGVVDLVKKEFVLNDISEY